MAHDQDPPPGVCMNNASDPLHIVVSLELAVVLPWVVLVIIRVLGQELARSFTQIFSKRQVQNSFALLVIRSR